MKPTQFVESQGVRLAVYTWGQRGSKAKPKPTVLFIHGYPDSASVWRKTAEALADRYLVVAYDVRGAGQSTRPKRIRDYAMPLLSADLVAVLDAVSPDQSVHLVGHDWGSIQTWESVTDPTLRERIASFTTISGPCLDHAAHWMRERIQSGSTEKRRQALRQLAHSWYIVMFQLPLLGPMAWRLGLDQRWPNILRKVEGIHEPETNETQREDGAFGVNLYRANFIRKLTRPEARYTDVPVQLIQPLRDNYMVREIWDDLAQWAPKLWRRELDAGHWVPLSHADTIAQWVSEFVDFVESGEASDALQQAQVA